MWITFTTSAHTAWELVPALTTGLRFASAALGFGIAVHRTIRYWRSNRDH